MPVSVKIDLVTHDPASDEFVLYLVEDVPWPESEEEWQLRLKAIQDRVLAAADVAIDGHLAGKYPDSIGKSVRIQVDSPLHYQERVTELISDVDRFLVEDPSYAKAVRSSRHIRGIRVVTGTEMGRFQ